MQEIQDLIPQYREIQELYQSEAFKPLIQFLSNTQKQVYANLLQIDWKKPTAQTEAITLTTQLNMIGVFSSLPVIIKTLKDQFEANEVKTQELKKAAVDPMYKGDYK